MKVHLIGSEYSETIAIPRIPAIIGRDAECDVRLADPRVAPFHCMLGQRDGTLLHMWSLRTEAHTLLNGRPVLHARVLPGDRLTVGSAEFVVEYEVARPRSSQDRSLCTACR